MSQLIFHNPGEIDIRGACIAGLSAKESKSPIGFFGTGLKYAIACILRWDGEITIYSGEQKYTFHAEQMEFRGSEFHQVMMRTHKEDGRFDLTALGFTTEYGKKWKPWQVFRELYANARDENGTVQLGVHSSMIGEGWTHIFVDCPQVEKQFYERDRIILPQDMHYEQQNADVSFSAVPSVAMYYRGVKVHDQPGYYTWNFTGELQLTEDRTLSSVMAPTHYFDQLVLQNLHDVEICTRLLEIKYAENDPQVTKIVERDGKPHSLSVRPIEAALMDWFTMPTVAGSWHSNEFKEAAVRCYQRDTRLFKALRPYVQSIDVKLIQEQAHKMTPREQLMFDKAKELVAMFGFQNEISRVPITVCDLGGKTLGLYEQGHIYLSPQLFDMGTKQLVSTLYEECYHHRTQNQDLTYGMQSNLFDIIISLNEELHKVIC